MFPVKLIDELLQESANKDEAIKMESYMKNNFKFFGARAPVVKEIFKKLITVYTIHPHELKELVTHLWKKDEREYQMIAILFLNRYQKWLKEEDIELIEYCITNKSWWDSVDSIAPNALGYYLKAYPQHKPEIIEKWLSSNNLWLQRSILLYQLKYKKDTDVSILFDSILRLKDSKEFFIQKAIGWALREYSKTDSQKVIDFVDSTNLANLSKKESLKWMKSKKIIR
ncbi:DNA alkylation repair protein [Heyndrickxia sporothermodurans]|uniref:DNA alkylation repair protein n=1 Tax=Heyndrickxia sporothermodurans TaxID=46224 RepID=A0AB37HET3_9BACI|nr:DNA alkylation repair protein [Heyndrickxia sporothermodurans]MBL5767241.1 DNA alkylation repair protein [Heyndrickxia sporothermodurans]MBL5770776.1 DNA alkylation repair protein [Heyndrickxia sporothermodurans]MBL5774407.1 DNA alkylation repair protein [Heyndrickxia sporothermodurans]MBL5777954.1 DNA alkylation repair protein [Heyndrickxia sporothermodurans]MBL5781532.1 DNA alkylation repair protein [Heyndrickxia sporothermodurans]